MGVGGGLAGLWEGVFDIFDLHGIIWSREGFDIKVFEFFGYLA